MRRFAHFENVFWMLTSILTAVGSVALSFEKLPLFWKFAVFLAHYTCIWMVAIPSLLVSNCAYFNEMNASYEFQEVSYEALSVSSSANDMHHIATKHENVASELENLSHKIFALAKSIKNQK